MYNSGDNRLAPSGYGITGYEMVVELLETLAPADRAASRLKHVRDVIRQLRGAGQNQPSASTTVAEPGCIQTAEG